MSDEPTFEKVLAIDVETMRWGVWSSTGGEPFVNRIMVARWADDGGSIWFGLDSHNSLNAKPDEVLELVAMIPYATSKPRTVGPKPAPPLHACPSCRCRPTPESREDLTNE